MSVHQIDPTKDGKSWQFRARKKDFSGKVKNIRSKRYATKREAEEAERIFLMKRDMPLKKEFNIVAQDYFENLLKIRKLTTVNTYKQIYIKNIKSYFYNKDISKIEIKDIRDWEEKLERRKLSLSYLNKSYLVLNSIVKFAIRNYGLEFNPVQMYGRFQSKNDKIIKNKEKIRYITLEEFNKFIKYVDDPMYNLFFYTAFYTGCRKGELYALTWEDIDFDKSCIEINKTLYAKVKGMIGSDVIITNTKNAQNRIIIMNKSLSDKLKSYKKEMRKYKDFKENWFVFGNTKYLSSSNVDRIKDKAFELSGVHRITMHEFRHSHVSMLVNEYIKKSKERNMNIDTRKFFEMLSLRMGHTVDVMEHVYLHLFPNVQDEIVDLLNEFF